MKSVVLWKVSLWKKCASKRNVRYSSVVCTPGACLQWLASVPLCLRWLRYHVTVGGVNMVKQDNIIQNIFFFSRHRFAVWVYWEIFKSTCCEPSCQVPAKCCCHPQDKQFGPVCPQQKSLCEQTWNCCGCEVFALSRESVSQTVPCSLLRRHYVPSSAHLAPQWRRSYNGNTWKRVAGIVNAHRQYGGKPSHCKHAQA